VVHGIVGEHGVVGVRLGGSIVDLVIEDSFRL